MAEVNPLQHTAQSKKKEINRPRLPLIWEDKLPGILMTELKVFTGPFLEHIPSNQQNAL